MSANLDALRRAVAVSPENAPLLALLAEGCLEQFLFSEAREIYQKILSLEPRNLEAQLGLAKAVYQEGNISEAVVRCEAMAGSHPANPEVWRMLSRLAIVEDKRSEAREYYEKARQLDPETRDLPLERDLYPRSAGGEAPRAIPVSGAGEDANADQSSVPDNQGAESESGVNPAPDQAGRPFEMESSKIQFSDVGGMSEVKEEIRMKIIYPLTNAELFRQYGKKSGGGVLMYGPPGCGKTLLSRAAAGEIKATFLSIGIHQVLDMWLGNSEKNLHAIFETARKHAPAILFFDEVDALACDRANLKFSAGRNVINQFLAEMDGAVGSNDGVLVLGATNAPWQVDPAFRRPGRFDRVLFVPPPDESARASIIEILAQHKPIAKLDAKALAKKTNSFSGADLKAVFDRASEQKLSQAMKENRMVPITMDDLIRAAKAIQPSTKSWFETARNHALYANQSGLYDDVLSFLGLKK